MTPGEIAEKMATCPFAGTAVAGGDLQVVDGPTNSLVPVNPLARIQDVKDLGNSGGGDLGNIFVLFALGNHAFMFGDDGQLTEKAPDDQFSLQFPGSKGSHHGHSGILDGDPTSVSSGRLSEGDFQRIESFATGDVIKRSDVGRFIAQNLLSNRPATHSAEAWRFLVCVDQAPLGCQAGGGSTVDSARVSGSGSLSDCFSRTGGGRGPCSLAKCWFV